MYDILMVTEYIYIYCMPDSAGMPVTEWRSHFHMNTQQIQIFLSVAANRNFTAAGEQLFLSQSVISYHIRALEKDLGFRLFDRSTHNVTLTPAGESFYSSLSELNRQYQEALDSATHIAMQDDNSLRICFANPTPPTMMGRIINRIYSIPHLENVELVRRSFDDVLQPLLRGTADILFTYPNFFREEPGLRMTPFCEVWPACLLAPGHPLAEKPFLELRDLAGQNLLTPDSRNFRLNFEQIYTQLQNCTDSMPQIDSTPQTFEQMLGLAAAGRGIILVYAMDNRRSDNIDGLVSIPLAGFPSDTLIMVWHEKRLGTAGRTLIENIKNIK